jgi:adenine-specific DNA glycosylase
MLEFPQVKTSTLDDAIQKIEKKFNTTLKSTTHHKTIKHVFTHKIWIMDVYHITTSDPSLPFYNMNTLREAMSRAHLKIIDSIKE